MFKTVKINPIIDELIRIRNNKIILRIDRAGKVILKAPNYISINDLNSYIDKKIKWITDKKKLVLSKKQTKKLFISGEKFLYLGQPKELVVVDDDSFAIKFEEDKFQICQIFVSEGPKLMEKLYRNLAWNYISHRTVELSKMHNFDFTNIKISKAKTNWGSCSSKNSLNFTWRLVMAPPDIIDYIIIHELSHTREHNHSEKFWNIVAEIIPDYKSKVKWLKINGHLLDF